MLISKKLFIGGLGAIVVGTAGTVPTLYYSQQTPVSAVSSQAVAPVTAAAETITGKPVRVVVDDLDVNLYVADGVFNAKTGEWTLSQTKAHYALMTVQPNNAQGNTLIYGHALSNVFGPLLKLKPGMEARVITDNGYEFVYTFISTKAVKPTDTAILDYQGAPNLTLQTCSGVWMQNRQLFDFDFVKTQKI